MAPLFGPEMIIVCPLKPTLTPPAPDMEPLLLNVVDDVAPVVFPTAVAAPPLLAETIMVCPLKPIEAPAAPLIEMLVPMLVLLVEPVVFPLANQLDGPPPPAPVAPEIIRVFPENPTDTAPAPEIDSTAPKVVDDVEPVVFPTTVSLRAGADTIMLWPENPTEAMPAPETLKLELKLVLEVEPVVLPTADHPSV